MSYLALPVSFPSVARSDASASRSDARPARSAMPLNWIARFGRCEVRVACREVFVDNCLRPLQPKAFNVLVYLIENRDRVVPADELLDQIWGEEDVQPGSLTAAVLRVRKALRESEAGIGSMIRNYARYGYRFVADTELELPSSRLLTGTN